MTYAQVGMDKAASRQPMDDQLDHGALADGNKRLRQHCRERAKSSALPAGKEKQAWRKALVTLLQGFRAGGRRLVTFDD